MAYPWNKQERNFVGLDLDIVLEIKDIDEVSEEVVDKGLKVEKFEHFIPSVILEKLK